MKEEFSARRVVPLDESYPLLTELERDIILSTWKPGTEYFFIQRKDDKNRLVREVYNMGLMYQLLSTKMTPEEYEYHPLCVAHDLQLIQFLARLAKIGNPEYRTED